MARWGNSGNSGRLYFGGAPKSLQMVTAAMKLKESDMTEQLSTKAGIYINKLYIYTVYILYLYTINIFYSIASSRIYTVYHIIV